MPDLPHFTMLVLNPKGFRIGLVSTQHSPTRGALAGQTDHVAHTDLHKEIRMRYNAADSSKPYSPCIKGEGFVFLPGTGVNHEDGI